MSELCHECSVLYTLYFVYQISMYSTRILLHIVVYPSICFLVVESPMEDSFARNRSVQRCDKRIDRKLDICTEMTKAYYFYCTISILSTL